MPDIALRFGAYYCTRDGYKCGPMEVSPGVNSIGQLRMSGYILGTGGRVFNALTGKHDYGNADLDLVSEWSADDEAALVVATAPIPAPEAEEQVDIYALIARAEVAEKDLAECRSYIKKLQSLHPMAVSAAGAIPAPEAVLADKATGAAIEAQAEADTLYRELRTQNPPVFAIENDELVVKITYEHMTITAGVGDGRYLFSQIVDKLLNPALLARHQMAKFVRDVASPND